MKYWARSSTVGDGLKPVYFSSVVIGDKAQQINKRALHSVISVQWRWVFVPSGEIP